MLLTISLIFKFYVPNPALRSIKKPYLIFRTMSDNANSEKKTYHKKATGIALNTVKKHAKDQDLKLFGSCFWYVLNPFPYDLLDCN